MSLPRAESPRGEEVEEPSPAPLLALDVLDAEDIDLSDNEAEQLGELFGNLSVGGGGAAGEAAAATKPPPPVSTDRHMISISSPGKSQPEQTAITPRIAKLDTGLIGQLISYVSAYAGCFHPVTSINEIDTLMKEVEDRPAAVESFDAQGVARLFTRELAPVKNVIVMVGAGVSVAAGIPDFRSPGTGLYDNLHKFNLPYPEAVFELSYFRQRPEPFFQLAKELYPGQYTPTLSHCFLLLLEEKGVLRRVLTQNIDSLEHVAGLPADKVVAAHGNFNSSHCIECLLEADNDVVRDTCLRGEVCRCSSCGGLVKPDIVFFGENLPARFFSSTVDDFPSCDLLVVMGTSLKVAPFCELIHRVGAGVPRVLINREKVREMGAVKRHLGMSDGFDFEPETRHRDVFFEGDCDDGVRKLAAELGWEDELLAIEKKVRAKIAGAGAATGAGAGEKET